MQEYETLSAQAIECGFTHCAPLTVSTLEFMQDVRDMCNEKQCDRYGKSWSCPPACPSLEEMRENVLSYSGGILVQTVGDLEDSYDWEGIMDAGKRHKENFGRMREALESGDQPILAMGAGACNLCQSCTYPDAPCRFPDKMAASMEASGLFVSKVCTDNGLNYNYGPNKIAFTSCYLIG
ncbi:MAG: DUF2284 domain-containing protein [Oscillospiraceae bacterium]|jgi:predicted metal-binding protein|nr:DUF2284 domain-containing protein [Oscillospiraceae bacterium]